MPKKQLLPPSGDVNKREVSVNLRFSVDDHARLKKVADFSGTTVANLLFYVTLNTTLPMMEQEVQRASTQQIEARHRGEHPDRRRALLTSTPTESDEEQS
jgi:hypothetical protein